MPVPILLLNMHVLQVDMIYLLGDIGGTGGLLYLVTSNQERVTHNLGGRQLGRVFLVDKVAQLKANLRARAFSAG